MCRCLETNIVVVAELSLMLHVKEQSGVKDHFEAQVGAGTVGAQQALFGRFGIRVAGGPLLSTKGARSRLMR